MPSLRSCPVPAPTRGWYPCPSTAGQDRYFDGRWWTDDTRPASPPGTSPAGQGRWLPDPRWEGALRWWDGQAWTGRVAGDRAPRWQLPPVAGGPALPGRAVSWTVAAGLVAVFVAVLAHSTGSTLLPVVAGAFGPGACLLAATAAAHTNPGGHRKALAAHAGLRWPGGAKVAVGGAAGAVATVAVWPLLGAGAGNLSVFDAAVVLAVAVVVVPVYEELFFRTVVADRLIARFGLPVGLAAQTAVFAAARGVGGLAGAAAAVPAGLVAGWLWSRWRSLWPPVAAAAAGGWVTVLVAFG